MTDGFKDIEKLESALWEAADNLRANSKRTSSDYFIPVLGVIFLRHAANRFEEARRQIEEDQAAGRMPKGKVVPAAFAKLFELANSLDAEEKRAVKEGLSEDELAFFRVFRHE